MRMRNNARMPDEVLIERVQQRLAELGLTPRAASLAATGKPDSIRNILRGRKPRSDTLDAIAGALACSTDYLLGKSEEISPSGRGIDQIQAKSGANAPSQAGPGANMIENPPEFGERTLPVLGVAVAGSDEIVIHSDQPLYYVRRPPSLMGVQDGYVVIVAGDSMNPRYFDGEAVYVHPRRRIVGGEQTFVVVQLRPETEGEPPPAVVKRYIRQTSKELVLEQYNPPKEIRYPLRDVLAVHLIVPALEPHG